MSVQLKCPRCDKGIRVEEDVAAVRCPNCKTLLNLGASRKSSERAVTRDKNDNSTALKIMAGVVGVAIFIAILASLSDDEPKVVKKKKRDDSYASSYLGSTVPMDLTEISSVIPERIGRTLMMAMAQDDPDAIEPLILWTELFETLAKENNWDEERRYANVDDAGKSKMRDGYLMALMDPDYVQIIQDRLMSELEDGIDTPMTDAGVDWCNVRYVIYDKFTDPWLEIILKTKLLPGRDPKTEAANPSAWRVYGIKHHQHKAIKGKAKKRGSKDFGARLGKNPKKKRTRRTGPKGPPQADLAAIPWLEGTSPTMQAKLNELIKAALDNMNPKASNVARSDLANVGKAAIPGLLTSLSVMNHKDDAEQILNAWVLVQVLREMTGEHFGYGPQTTSGARGSLTQATPEERVIAVRRWFGWWESKGQSFTLEAKKKVADEGWGSFETEKDKKAKKKK